MIRSCLLIAGLSCVIGHWSVAADVVSPLSPADAQKAMVLADASLKIELAAAEPEVVDPVAIRFDEDGRMWVVEMRDYPLGNPTGGEPLSQIRVLEDRDGDGRFEKATTFADKLLFVTGLQPWKGGVFVTLSGRVAYMKDTDGDGRCDLDETWFEGFAEQNSQLRANHPRLALDNWIYVANGLRGGSVVNRKLKDQEPINISGMDFRFDPLTGKAEAVSGNGQFGLCFDDWGNRFTCSNRNPVKHVVIEDRYLKANPAVTVPAVVHDVAAFGEQSRIYAISRAWTTSNLHAGQFTAACGVYIYRGDLLPAEFKGNAFTCDPTGNLIHREIMQPAGPTFTSKPAYEGKEFLASADEWFRPVNMELGPDGALYVVDMYRCVIEHPDFVPDELKRRPDQRLGDDRGRIWRIVPKVGRSGPERPAPPNAPALSKTSSDDLVQLIKHPNAWQRETAQRLLLERQEKAVARDVEALVSNDAAAATRLHAAYTLVGLQAQPSQHFASKIIGTKFPGTVRRHALLLAEILPAGSIQIYASGLFFDPDPAVTFQLLLSLPMIDRKYSRLAVSDQRARYVTLLNACDDPWVRSAALLCFGSEMAPGNVHLLLTTILDKPRRKPGSGLYQLVEASSELIPASGSEEERQRAIETAVKALNRENKEIALVALAGMSRQWSRGKSLPLDPNGNSLLPLDKLLRLAREQSLDWSFRSRAITLLAFIPPANDEVVRLTDRANEQRVRIAAISALMRHNDVNAWQTLISGFPSDTPPIRRAIIDGLLANTDRTKLLLDAIEAGRIKPSELDPPQTKRLVESRDAEIKQRAAKLFAALTPADRTKALADYQPVLQMKGEAAKGQVVFEKNCAACHKIMGIGSNVAPDISDSRTKKLDQLLGDILQPNRAIDNNYLGYTVRLLDGQVLTGILTAETATSITVRQQGGKDAVIARSEIDELKSSGQSLMPEGLERQIPQAEMADLLSFIKNWRYLDGRTPLSPAGN